MSEAKRLAAEKAIDYVEDGMIVGVGTGSTVAYFIDALGRISHRIKGAVSSSEQSSAQLRRHGIEVLISTTPAICRCMWMAPTSATRTVA